MEQNNTKFKFPLHILQICVIQVRQFPCLTNFTLNATYDAHLSYLIYFNILCT